jgi:hypothetical protein
LKRDEILKRAEKIICKERQDVHGDPEDSFALIADYWTAYVTKEMKDRVDLFGARDVAIMMALFKLARMQINGQHVDSVIDGCGYLAIAGELSAQEG